MAGQLLDNAVGLVADGPKPHVFESTQSPEKHCQKRHHAKDFNKHRPHELTSFSVASSRISARNRQLANGAEAIKGIKRTMMFLKDQHGPQPNSPLPAAPNINAHSLRLLEESISSRAIPGDKCALALAS